MTGFLEIPPVGEIWPESALEIPAAIQSGITEWPEYTPFVLAGLIIAALVFSRRIVYGVAGSAAILFTPANRSDLSDGLAFRKDANLTMAFCIPVLSLILVLTGVSRQNIAVTAAAISAYLLLQIAAYKFTGTFSNPDCNDSGMTRGRSIFILFTAVLMPAAIIAASSASGISFAAGYVATVALPAFLLFAISSLRSFFSFRFSFIFSFLYLCGIQLLPLAVIIKFLLD